MESTKDDLCRRARGGSEGLGGQWPPPLMNQSKGQVQEDKGVKEGGSYKRSERNRKKTKWTQEEILYQKKEGGELKEREQTKRKEGKKNSVVVPLSLFS